MYMDRKLNIVQMTALPNLKYRFSETPVRSLASYFVDIDKLI